MITMTDANMTTLTMIKEIIKVELLCKSSHICLKSNRFEDLTMMQMWIGFQPEADEDQRRGVDTGCLLLPPDPKIVNDCQIWKISPKIVKGFGRFQKILIPG